MNNKDKPAPKNRSKQLPEKKKKQPAIIPTIKVDSTVMKDSEKIKRTRNRSKLENSLNEWYNWLVETNHNELFISYPRVFSHAPKTVK